MMYTSWCAILGVWKGVWRMQREDGESKHKSSKLKKKFGPPSSMHFAVALSKEKGGVLSCCWGCSFHLGRPPTQFTATDLLAVYEE